MNRFSLLFLLLLFIVTAVQLWLARRQWRHVGLHRGQVPDSFRDRVTLEAHQRAADYTLAKVRFGMVEAAYGALLLLLWTLGGGLELLASLWQGAELGAVAGGTALLVSAFLLMGLLDLPLAAYRTFGLEQRFGFNRSTARLFLADTARQALLLMLIGTPLAALVLWLMATAGTGWWFYVWLVWMAFGVTMMWAYPAFIAPLFNKFTPLEDEELAMRVKRLLERCGFAFAGLFVMDGSRRSAHGNAFFTGLGSNKRIVFYDTLLRQLNGDEIEAVLAHELGHFKRRHVVKRFLLVGAMSLAGLALLGWLQGKGWFYAGLGVSTPSVASALLLFLMISPLFTFFVQPLMAHLMRRDEFEADEFAAGNASAGDLVRALVKLYEENASTLTPDPLYSAFHDSHPPAPIRVARLKELAEQTEGSA